MTTPLLGQQEANAETTVVHRNIEGDWSCRTLNVLYLSSPIESCHLYTPMPI